MLLDSGSDVTLVPSSFVERLDLNVDSELAYELMAFDGSLSLASVVHLEILFINRTFRGRFLVIEQEWGVIGRNLMNLLSLVFDGPKKFWEEFNR